MITLEKAFPNQEKLAFARKVLFAVPAEIGTDDTTQAHLPLIVKNAFIDGRLWARPSGPFIEEQVAYCEEHHIMDRLIEAGHVREMRGFAYGGPLYTTPLKEE